MAKNIKINAAMCKSCKKILISRHVHDFLECGCESDIMIDGGLDYWRCGYNKKEDFIRLYTEEDIEKAKLIKGSKVIEYK